MVRIRINSENDRLYLNDLPSTISGRRPHSIYLEITQFRITQITDRDRQTYSEKPQVVKHIMLDRAWIDHIVYFFASPLILLWFFFHRFLVESINDQ